MNQQPPDPKLERLKLGIEVWKTTVGVQQHFNDLELRIRNYAVTLLVAVLGGTGLALKEGFAVTVAGRSISLASILLAAGFVGWMAFYLMDRHWYHRLLYGAVKHAEEVEGYWKGELPKLGLTKAISAHSPIEITKTGWKFGLGVLSGLVLAIPFLITLALDKMPWSPSYISASITAAVCIVIASTVLYFVMPRHKEESDVWVIRSTAKMDLFYGVIGVLLLFLIWAADVAVKMSVPAQSAK